VTHLTLGTLADSGAPFRLPLAALDTHLHLIGGTGKGKTTAIQTLLHPLLADPVQKRCVIAIDRLGGFSRDLLLWMASPFCPEHVRRRLVYIEPAREDVVLGFNPLLYDSLGHGYYKVAHASEITLRGWASQNLAEMPRLARWLFNSFWAAAQLGLTIADCAHLLLPGSPYHEPLLAALPATLRAEWAELLTTRGAEVSRILESSRNRLKPFWDCPALRQMFSATANRLDVLRFMREGRIVLVNLAPYNRLPEQMADAVGGLVVNEVLTTARSLPMGVRYPTYLILDEFQRFVGPDLEAAIPEVRQLGVRLVLSHQGLSQLQRGETDLTSLIWQCQSRTVLGVQGEDADLLAHELASLTFDPRKVKDELYGRRQRVSGHRVTELASHSFSAQEAENWSKSYGSSFSRPETYDLRAGGLRPGSRSEQEGGGGGGSRGSSHTHGSHEQLVPVYEEFVELMNRTYVTFEEDRNVWARDIRRLPRGGAFVRLVDDPRPYRVQVKKDMPGHLAWEVEKLARFFPKALDAMEALVEANFRQDVFCAPRQIEAETHERLQRVLGGRIVVLPAADPVLPAPAPGERPDDGEAHFT
jgi:hypothetical protein